LHVDGSKNIEDIEVGDLVYAKNTETGETGWKKVAKLFRCEINELVHFQIGDESIETTLEHPFWVEGEGFKAAGELEEGEYVQTADGEILPVVKVQKEYLKESVIVYNFEVEDWHTYYVSDEEVLVHNTCMMQKGGQGNNSSKFKDGELYEDFIEVDGHRIEALAEVKIDNNTLTLKDLAIYSNEGDIPNQIGHIPFLKWKSVVSDEAKSLGFDKLRIMAQRAMHSISANPGKTIDITINLK